MSSLGTTVELTPSNRFRSHNSTRAPIQLQQRHRRDSNAPPILVDDDDMMTIEAEVESGARANRERKRDALAWDYRDATSGGCGGGGEVVSEDEVILGFDERNAPGSVIVGLARGAGVWGIMKDGPGQWCVRYYLFSCIMYAYFPLCGRCKCERFSSLELVLR